jgi:hypothetical protein
VGERLRQHRTENNDVERGDVGPDVAVLLPSAQDLPKSLVDVGSEGDSGLVEGHGAAVHGKHEVGAVLDGAVKELTEGVDRRAFAVDGPRRCFEDNLEGPVREGSEQGLTRRVAPVEGADADPSISGDGGEGNPGALSPYGGCCGGENSVAVDRRVSP